MTDEKRLRGERIRLDIDICTGDLVKERRFADVGISTDEKSTSSGVDCGETRHVFANLFEELESLVLPLHDGSHAAESSTLELLASVQTITELEKTDVVFGDLINKMPSGAQLTECELIMVLII